MFRKFVKSLIILALFWTGIGIVRAERPRDTPQPSAPPKVAPVAHRLPILEYHTTNFQMGLEVMMTPDWFEKQMRWLADNHFATLTADQLADYVEGKYLPPQKAVALTFDVGLSSFDDYVNVIVPTLQRYHLHAIFFVLANRTRDECDGKITCWPTLKRWVEAGDISIGSHSLYHIDYAELTPDAIMLDAGRSKAIIEQKLGVTVTALCYPYDSVSPAAMPILKALGYRLAVAGPTRHERSVLFADAEPYNLPRYYPYSSWRSYPALVGMHGKPFNQVLWEAIELSHRELSQPSAMSERMR